MEVSPRGAAMAHNSKALPEHDDTKGESSPEEDERKVEEWTNSGSSNTILDTVGGVWDALFSDVNPIDLKRRLKRESWKRPKVRGEHVRTVRD